eukprot:m.129907 g.129907  ORF g.129907 m.129907 type:complete len:429 (-) comp16422_c3_seq3:1093-2379(-)
MHHVHADNTSERTAAPGSTGAGRGDRGLRNSSDGKRRSAGSDRNGSDSVNGGGPGPLSQSPKSNTESSGGGSSRRSYSNVAGQRPPSAATLRDQKDQKEQKDEVAQLRALVKALQARQQLLEVRVVVCEAQALSDSNRIVELEDCTPRPDILVEFTLRANRWPTHECVILAKVTTPPSLSFDENINGLAIAADDDDDEDDVNDGDGGRIRAVEDSNNNDAFAAPGTNAHHHHYHHHYHHHLLRSTAATPSLHQRRGQRGACGSARGTRPRRRRLCRTADDESVAVAGSPRPGPRVAPICYCSNNITRPVPERRFLLVRQQCIGCGAAAGLHAGRHPGPLAAGAAAEAATAAADKQDKSAQLRPRRSQQLCRQNRAAPFSRAAATVSTAASSTAKAKGAVFSADGVGPVCGAASTLWQPGRGRDGLWPG